MMRLDPYRFAAAEAEAPQATFLSGGGETTSGGYAIQDFNFNQSTLVESTFDDPELIAFDSSPFLGGNVRLVLASESGAPAQDVYTSIQVYDESGTLIAEFDFADASYQSAAWGSTASSWRWTSEGDLFDGTDGEQFTIVVVP